MLLMLKSFDRACLHCWYASNCISQDLSKTLALARRTIHVRSKEAVTKYNIESDLVKIHCIPLILDGRLLETIGASLTPHDQTDNLCFSYLIAVLKE